MARMKITYDDGDGEQFISKRDEVQLEKMDAARQAAEFDSMTDEQYWAYRKIQDRKIEKAQTQAGHSVSKSVGNYPLDRTMASQVEDLRTREYGPGEFAYDAFYSVVQALGAQRRADRHPGYEGITPEAATNAVLDELNGDELGRAALNYAHTSGRAVKIDEVPVSKNLGTPRDAVEAFVSVYNVIVELVNQ